MSTPRTVFAVWHIHDLGNGEEDWKFIGVYSSAEQADAAKRRVAALPGFRDAPDGFDIDELTLDEDLWTEGYVTRDASTDAPDDEDATSEEDDGLDRI